MSDVRLRELERQYTTTNDQADLKKLIFERSRLKIKSTDFAGIICEQQIIENEIIRLQKQRQKEGFERLERLAIAAFEKFPTFKGCTYLGWTPGFNDGDPCTHNSELLLTEADFADWGLEEEFEELYENDSYSLLDKDEKILKAAFSLFEETIEDKWGTDYRVTIRNSKPAIEYEQYDCGY